MDKGNCISRIVIVNQILECNMRLKYTLFLFCLLSSQPIFSQNMGKAFLTGCWFYQDGYTRKQIIFKNETKFYWYYSSCEGDICFKGKYKFENDTIYMSPKRREIEKFILRDNKIYTYPGKNWDYPELEVLTKVNKQKRHKCNYEEMEIIVFEDD